MNMSAGSQGRKSLLTSILSKNLSRDKLNLAAGVGKDPSVSASHKELP